MRAFVRFGLACVLSVMSATWVVAQSAEDVVWVQIEAHPSLTTAQQRASLYAIQIEDVTGFALPGGWFGIAVGPYRRADAEQVLRVYLAERFIPSDSFIAFSTDFRRQFFPPGEDILNRGVIRQQPAPEPEQDTVAQAPATEQEPVVVPEAPDETPAQARRSEQLLTSDERKDIQIALKWAGFYNNIIDGAFGRGTRASMGAWQKANNFDVTGILTTRQRVVLFQQYNAVLDGLGLQLVQNNDAGIEMLVPTDVVAENGLDYPFAKYSPTGDLDAQVLMISQNGDQSTLIGLYNLMQTLEIVPLDGQREQRGDRFLLIGEDNNIVSHTEAELISGEIKGFSLVWPAGDEERRTRVLEEIRASFKRLDGALDPSWSDNDAQSVDLVAGLQIRKPRLSRSGFFVSAEGAVVTTQEAVQSCARVTLDEDTDAQVTATNDALGLAVLTPDIPVTPRGIAQFASRQPRLNSEAVVSGFSYEGVLGAPTVTFGSVSDLTGLRGETDLTRLDVPVLEGDAGGPVFDEAGGVLGMLLPRDASGRQLPDNVSFAAKSSSLQALLNEIGITSQVASSQTRLAPEDITTRAQDMTVLVSCWD